MTNYQVADFLIRLKNASMANIKQIEFKNTKIVSAVAKTLKKEGFLDTVTEKDGLITVTLSIFRKKPVLTNVKIISRPGLRIYMNVDELESIKTPEMFIISTPKGVMSHKDAIKQRLGGEVISKVI